MEYSVKDGYTLQWYRDYDFSVANGAQRFTLNYGSNFQFLTVSTNQNVVATYLVDFYVLRDYAINLYSNIYAEKPYTTTYVVENRTLSADTTPYQLKDFVFDKRVYWNTAAGNGWGDWVAFNYSTLITKDWDLYQTYKPVTMTADLDGGTLESELTVTPYTEYQQLPVPVKEGYDFIGWQLPDAQNTKENYFTDINGFNATQLLGAGGGVNGDVYFKTLKAVWSPKQYYKVTEGDVVSFKEMVPVATYTDKSLTEINEIIYVLYGTDCIVPTKVVYDGAFEFFGWNSYKTDENGDIYGSPFNFNIKVTEPIAIYQDMGSLRDGTTLTALGLYLNGTRTFTSIGTGQRIKAWLPAKATYSFTVTTDNYVNFSCDSSSYNVTSSSPKTITVSCTSSLGQAVYFDVSSYGGSFSIEFNGPTGTTEGNPVQISSENLVSLGGEVVTPEKPGYTFLGWYDDDDVKISEEGSRAFVFQQYEEGATYTMKWQKCATILAVNDENAGSVSGLEGTTVAGGEVTVIADPAPLYVFVGWYNSDDELLSTDAEYTFVFGQEPGFLVAKFESAPETESDDFVFSLNSSGDGYALTSYNGEDTSVVIPSSYNGLPVVEIGSYAFQNDAFIEGIYVPDSVTKVGSYVFSGCSGLTVVVLENGVKSIGSSAFSGCTGLTSVTIPDGVTSIGSSAFSGCSGLKSITIPFVGAEAGKTSSDTYQYPFGYIFGTTSYTGGTKVKQYYYGSSTSSTTNSTYYIPSSLREVTVTGGNILRGAFSSCTGLTSVTIGDGVISIGVEAFRYCTGLTSVTIGDGVTSIGGWAFYGCNGLTSVTIGEGVTSIGDRAFYDCTGLTSVTIGEGVTSIGYEAFRNCTGLTSVTIGDGVTSIGDAAFEGCNGLTSVYISDIAAWCGIAFGGSGANPLSYAHNLYLNGELVTDLVIPDSVTSIGYNAFRNCSGLTSVTIPDSVTSIGRYAFYSCSGLTSVTFEETSGWFRSPYSSATSGTDISADSLSDKSTAASYLKSKYYNYYWKRNA